MYDKRNKLSNEVEQEARNYFKEKFIQQWFQETLDCQKHHHMEYLYLFMIRVCPGSKAYFSFTDEFLNQDKPMESAA